MSWGEPKLQVARNALLFDLFAQVYPTLGVCPVICAMYPENELLGVGDYWRILVCRSV